MASGSSIGFAVGELNWSELFGWGDGATTGRELRQFGGDWDIL